MVLHFQGMKSTKPIAFSARWQRKNCGQCGSVSKLDEVLYMKCFEEKNLIEWNLSE